MGDILYVCCAAKASECLSRTQYLHDKRSAASQSEDGVLGGAATGHCVHLDQDCRIATRYAILQVHGMRCDVSQPEDMAELGRFASQQLDTVHFWINNAGSVTRKKMLADVDPTDICSAVGGRSQHIAVL